MGGMLGVEESRKHLRRPMASMRAVALSKALAAPARSFVTRTAPLAGPVGRFLSCLKIRARRRRKRRGPGGGGGEGGKGFAGFAYLLVVSLTGLRGRGHACGLMTCLAFSIARVHPCESSAWPWSGGRQRGRGGAGRVKQAVEALVIFG